MQKSCQVRWGIEETLRTGNCLTLRKIYFLPFSSVWKTNENFTKLVQVFQVCVFIYTCGCVCVCLNIYSFNGTFSQWATLNCYLCEFFDHKTQRSVKYFTLIACTGQKVVFRPAQSAVGVANN